MSFGKGDVVDDEVRTQCELLTAKAPQLFNESRNIDNRKWWSTKIGILVL